MTNSIDEIIENIFTNSDVYLVQKNIGQNKISLFIDGIDGVTINECAIINRKLSNILEQEDLIKNSYVVEVSSPGITAPLKDRRQFIYNVNRRLTCKLKDSSVVKGKLVYVGDVHIIIENNGLIEILFIDLVEAKIDYKF